MKRYCLKCDEEFESLEGYAYVGLAQLLIIERNLDLIIINVLVVMQVVLRKLHRAMFLEESINY